MIYVGVIPYDRPFISNFGSTLYVHNFYDGVAVDFGGCIYNITALKYSNAILLGSLGAPIIFDGKPITHNEAYLYTEKCVKNYKRIKKLERVCQK